MTRLVLITYLFIYECRLYNFSLNKFFFVDFFSLILKFCIYLLSINLIIASSMFFVLLFLLSNMHIFIYIFVLHFSFPAFIVVIFSLVYWYNYTSFLLIDFIIFDRHNNKNFVLIILIFYSLINFVVKKYKIIFFILISSHTPWFCIF